jgi:L-aspartate oxidase
VAPLNTDTLIIGCGIAGASAALRLARDTEREITVLTRASDPNECATHYAQGGIVARGPDDSHELLVQDIMQAGCLAGLPKAVEQVAALGPKLVDEVLIQEAGVQFDRLANGEYAYTGEGGHSRRRVLHVVDATGKAIERALIDRLRALPNVRLQTSMTAVDLITTSHHTRYSLHRYEPARCLGVYAFSEAEQTVMPIIAETTILATGGLGQIYQHTTNPKGARGDGLAMAHRAGARIVDAEYIQFHPTTLAAPGGGNFLITEAMRGEGGRLRTPEGRYFMQEYSPSWGDLAPRDVVARAILREMTLHQYPYVLLDIASEMDASTIRERFPTIVERCNEVGIDITAEPIPVVPAAHYACGGVLVDDRGRSTIQSLYAVGEVSCTGLHGANRLASTSLLEGLVWGWRAGEDIADRGPIERVDPAEIPAWLEPDGDIPDAAVVEHDTRMIQDLMWLYVGLARSGPRINRAIRALDFLRHDVEHSYRSCRLTDSLIGLRNMLDTAWVVAHSAWRNKRSLGTHYREDAAEPHASLLDTTTPENTFRYSEF